MSSVGAPEPLKQLLANQGHQEVSLEDSFIQVAHYMDPEDAWIKVWQQIESRIVDVVNYTLRALWSAIRLGFYEEQLDFGIRWRFHSRCTRSPLYRTQIEGHPWPSMLWTIATEQEGLGWGIRSILNDLRWSQLSWDLRLSRSSQDL